MIRILSAALLAAGLTVAAASVALAEPVEREGNVYHVAVCKRAIPANQARCLAHVVTDSKGNVLSQQPTGSRFTPAGLGATDLQSAYNITTMGSSKTIVAIVDAFGYPTAEADLGMYRAQYGLPPCTTANGCFMKLNQKGKKNKFPDENVSWAVETALDLDMASAMCPNCTIMLVEANTNSFKNLAAAEDTAAAKGAHVISNSYTGGDKANMTPYAESYHHPGVAITAATGDDGYEGAAFPASSPYTTAVGGTALTKNANVARGWSETAWAGAGSGCSKFAAKPSWQTDKGCKKRMTADVSAVASPATAVAIYAPIGNGSQSGWTREGGTSVATPLIGGVYGNNGGKVTDGSDPYAHTDALYDVTSGSNGPCPGKPSYYCTAGTGYDGPTGLGTPNGNTAF